MGITKFVLKRPVTAMLIILSMVFFGIVSLTQFKYELTPEINMPMYIVSTVYPGASPEDVDDLITGKIEEKAYNLQGAKDITCVSRENYSLVVIQYEYNQNMDKAYNDLKKMVDTVKEDFNDSVREPSIIEMDMNSVPTMRIAVRNKATTDIYNYVTNTFVKEIEKISDVASVDTSGGQENYIKISLKPEQLKRYNLSMTTLASIIKAADFAYPAGTVKAGKLDLSMTTKVDYETVEALKTIPIITGNKRTLYLEDVADVYITKEDATAVGRYDGEDCMIVSVSKVQSASSVTVSRSIKRTLDRLRRSDPNLEVTIVNDQADNINHSIENVFQTMIIAIILSMLVIFLFLGDFKGSLIIGTSIPFSLLTALVSIKVLGYTLNLITLSAMVLGVGMMVDNSIVVLEQCFRTKETYPDANISDYIKTAAVATNTIGLSVFGSTLTTVVVFGPLGFLSGMSGQFFKPLGFTIVSCMLASFVSAITIVPLTFVLFKPTEKNEPPVGKIMNRFQNFYREIMVKYINIRVIIIIVSVVFLIVGFMLLPTFKTELVSATDEGMIQINVSTKPGLRLDEKNKIYNYFEDFVTQQEEVEHYVLSNSTGSMSMSVSSGGQSLIAYLKDKRKKTTKQLVNEWKHKLSNVTDCSIDISSYSTSFTSTFVVPTNNGLDIYLESTDYNKLKTVNDNIKKELEKRDDVANIITLLDNAAPVVRATIDPILAAAEGFTPAQVGATLNGMLSGTELYDLKIDGEILTIKLEYPNGEYDNLDRIEDIQLTSSSGAVTTLKDIAVIEMEDSPSDIRKYNKKYRTQIKCDYKVNASENINTELRENVIKPLLNKDVTIAVSTVDEMIGEEFGSLFTAVIIAIFLVFVVMASQFESVRYSVMVMGTVLFSFVGGLYFLWLSGLKLSMVALLGFLMLVGTAVNNGILFVDTTNQHLDAGYELQDAIIEAGALRLRPILMTTLTTIVSMIPMALAYGRNGEILQPLGIVNIGGLVISTLMAFFILPILYFIFGKRKQTILEHLAHESKQALKDVKSDTITV